MLLKSPTQDCTCFLISCFHQSPPHELTVAGMNNNEPIFWFNLNPWEIVNRRINKPPIHDFLYFSSRCHNFIHFRIRWQWPRQEFISTSISWSSSISKQQSYNIFSFLTLTWGVCLGELNLWPKAAERWSHQDMQLLGWVGNVFCD